MADDVDLTTERDERMAEAFSRRLGDFILQSGKPGDCEECGEWAGRLLDGICCPCIDQRARQNR